MKRNKLFFNLTKISLSLLMGFGSITSPVYAEETPITETGTEETPQEGKTTEVVVEQAVESATNPSEEVPSEQGTAPTTEQQPTVKEDEPSVPVDVAEAEKAKAETPAASDDTSAPEGEAVETPATEGQTETATDTKEEAVPAKTDAVEEVETEEVAEVEEEHVSTLTIYKAEDIIDYVSAVAALKDETSSKLVLRSFDDLNEFIDFGTAVYFDGTYNINFANEEEAAKAYDILADKLGEDAIVKDVAMNVDWVGEPEDTANVPAGESEATEETSKTTEEVTAPAETTATEETAVATEENGSETTKETPVEQEPAGEEIVPDEAVVSDATAVAEVAAEANADTQRKTVALIDSGVNGDLADASVNLTNDPDADAVGHGTAMAETIKNIAGDNASILSIKAFNDDGTGSISTVTAAVKYAIAMDVDYINISASILDSDDTALFKAEIQNALNKGIVVVASAGNNGTDASLYAPANIDGVDTIGACESFDGFTAFKVTPFSNYGDTVDWYYISDSTSTAAAMETGVLVAGLEDEGYSTGNFNSYTNGWFRISDVFTDKDSPEYNDSNIASQGDKLIPVEQLIAEQGFATKEQEESRKFHLNAGWYCSSNVSGGDKVCVERYPAAGGGWNYSISNFYFYPSGTYYDGAKGLEGKCQEPDVVSSAEFSSFSCSFTSYGETGSTYDGVVIDYDISFDGASVSAYDPTQTYTWTDSNGNLSDGDYDSPQISVGNGDASKVHASVSGNTLKVWFDADPNADMPDDITIRISGGKSKAATSHSCTGEGGGSWYCSSAGQDIAGGGGSPRVCTPGEDGYDYNDATVHLNIIRGGFELTKWDKEKQRNEAQGDASLAGAQFTAYRNQTSKVTVAPDTDANGHTKTAGNALKWGNYTVKETKAPEGYFADENWTGDVQIRTSGQNINLDGTSHAQEQVYKGGIKVIKHDADFFDQHPQGDASLENTIYGIYNVSPKSVIHNNTEVSNTGDKTISVNGRNYTYGDGNLITTLKTNAMGEAETSNDELSYGTYLVVELEAPEGYLNENPERGGLNYKKGALAEIIVVHTDKKTEVSQTLSNAVKRGKLIVGKVDAERDANWPDGTTADKSPDKPNTAQGDATLAGAQLAIYLDSENHVMVDDKEYQKGDIVKIIRTNAEGIAETEPYSLPYGTYHVIEKEPSPGYLLNTEWRIDFKITEEGEVVDFAHENDNGKKLSDNLVYDDWLEETPIRGGIELTKVDVDRYITKKGGPNLEQGDASLEGAEFSIYNLSIQDSLIDGKWIEPVKVTNREQAQAMRGNEERLAKVITTDKEGFATTAASKDATEDRALPYGTYLILETKAPEGYLLNDWWYSIVEIREDGKIYDAVADNTKKSDNPYDGAMVDEPIRGGVKFQKADYERAAVKEQGDATLEGAEITIYNVSKMDVYGSSVQNAAKNPSYDGKISADGNVKQYDWAEAGEAVDVNVGDKDVDTLHQIYVNESTSVNTNIGNDDADNGGEQPGINSMTNTSRTGEYAYTVRVPEPYGAQTPYDDALENEDTQAMKADPRDFSNAVPVVTIVTDKTGLASLSADALPYGTYFAVETKPSRGYNLNTKWIVNFEIREDGVVLDFSDSNPNDENFSSTHEHWLYEQVIRGDVRVYKEDLELSELNGVKRNSYTCKIEASSDSPTYVDGEDNTYGGQAVPAYPPESNGYGYCVDTTPEKAHHAGVLNGVPGDLAYAEIKEASDDEAVKNKVNSSQAIGGNDHESRLSSLNNIEFTVTNASRVSVLSDANELIEYEPGKMVIKIYSHYDSELDTNGDGIPDSSGYIAETTNKALPYGTYMIQETSTEDNGAYMLTDGTPRYFEIEYDGQIADTSKQTHLRSFAGDELVFRNQIKRADFDFIKKGLYDSNNIRTLWVLENITSGERHVLVTENNGNYASYEYNHSDTTNENDAILDILVNEKGAIDYENFASPKNEKYKAFAEANGFDAKDALPLDKLINAGVIKPKAGLWFGLGEDGDMAKVNNTLGALPYGEYELYEVRTDSNETLRLVSMSFTVAQNSTRNNQGVIEKDTAIHLGTILDIGPTMKTSATDRNTGTRSGVPNEVSVIDDKINYEGFEYVEYGYGDYLLRTSLYNANTGEPILDADGNPYKAEKTVNISRSVGTIDADVTFNSITAGVKDVVVYEELFYVKDGEEILVAQHRDALDIKQTVTYPSIRTTLSNTTDTKKDKVPGVVYLSDKVHYTGLTPGKTYTMTGELHIKNEDGTDGGVVPGLEPISKEFTPRSKSGDVTIEAEIPAELLNGKTVVAFETCYEDGVALVIHADINDEDQTQTIKEPEIHTTATNKDTGTHSLPANEKKVFIQDKVMYTGLIPGKVYSIKGTLHSKNSPNPDENLKDASGNDIVSSGTFVPETSDGFVIMEFEVDTNLLQGETIVVYETLYRNNIEVCVHADINDEEQTVVVSDFGTSAATDKGEKSFPATETVTIVDTVTYSGLEIGHEYAVCGTIHTRVSDDVSLEITDGGVFAPAGQKCVNFTPTEGAGTVDVVFTFPGEELVSNQQLTVFEELFNASDIVDGKPKDGVTPLKEHKDITDDDQTVTVTKALKRIKTTAKGNKNGSVLAGSKKAVITDTIAYTGFESGKTYKFCGTLHKRGGTEGAYTDAGTIAPLNGAEANKDYVCSDAVEIKDVEKESGTVDVKFEFDASSLKKGDAIVVFERAYELDEKGEIPGGAGSDNHVARHEDINDKGQTVNVISPSIPDENPHGGGKDTPKSTPTPTSEQYITCQTLGYPAGYYWDASKQECVSIRHTNTGAENGIVWYVVGGVAVCAALAFVLYKKKKDSENNQETKKD